RSIVKEPVPEPLLVLIDALLAKEPSARPVSADHVHQALLRMDPNTQAKAQAMGTASMPVMTSPSHPPSGGSGSGSAGTASIKPIAPIAPPPPQQPYASH